jgi:putative membrane protein
MRVRRDVVPWDGGGHMGWMAIWWLLGIVLVVVLIWTLARGGAPFGPSGGAGESPEQIVKRRYAKGEIDRETYERMLADLKK